MTRFASLVESTGLGRGANYARQSFAALTVIDCHSPRFTVSLLLRALFFLFLVESIGLDSRRGLRALVGGGSDSY